MAEKYISQFTGQEIDERLAAVSEKYGHIEMRFNEQQSMYYMDCYASKQDFTDSKEPLDSILIPISTKQGTSYTAFLTGNISNTVDVVRADKKLEIALNYRAIQITEAGNINANAQGSLVVQRKTSTTDWTTVGQLDNILPSSEPTDTVTTTKVDVGQFLQTGKQNIRVQAVYDIVDDETGEKKTVRSGYVMVGQSVNLVELKLELNRDYSQVIDSVDVNGQPNKFPVDYVVYGTVQKTLHVEIQGSTGRYTASHELGKTFNARPTENLNVDDVDGYGLMSHGVHKVTAWLSCNDGLGGTIESPKLVNRFMVYNASASEEERMKPKLMLQDIDTVGNEVQNFVQKAICDYAVYSPKKNENGTITNDGEAVNVIFLLTAFSEDYETSKPEEYYRLELNVNPAQKNTLLTTVEIESESALDSYQGYLRVRRKKDGKETDFIAESTGETNYPVTIDNSQGFTPVAGATFILNPKVRNNSEADPKVIYNAANKNAVVESEFVNFGLIHDGWVTAEDGQKVLRIMAGEKLRIKLNMFKQFLTNPASSMTFSIDYKISNVTDEDTPVINLSEPNGSTFRGLQMNALGGWIKPASQSEDDNLFFGWQEDVRTQMILNINHAVRPNKGDVQYPASILNPNGTIPLARVLINGDSVREVPFKTDSKTEWCTTEDLWLEIGNDGADIDIYDIHAYQEKQIDLRQLQQRNYISALPTAEEKTRERDRNDLIGNNDLISLEKTKQKGLNCYVLHGDFPYHENTGTQRGWLEIFRYDDEGNYLPEFSGTICKESKQLPFDGQGSTAKTYWDWNTQDRADKAKAKIWVALADFHSSIHIRIDGDTAYIYGGNLGLYEPLKPTEKAYTYQDGKIEVPDGWIDGNNKYRGLGYQISPEAAQSIKNNLKINYASSPQAHLIAACKSYNLLHREVVGLNSIQEQYNGAVVAKMLEPMMVFGQAPDSDTAIFKGMGTYGAAKGDKVAWGYVEDLPECAMYAMIEGSDNNLPLTDFRVPFDHKVIPALDEDGEMEGWSYAGQVSWDYDFGRLSEDGTDAAPEIRKKFAEQHNFIYLHAPNLKYYNGTFAQFKQSDAAKKDMNSKYWCTQSNDGGWYLYRYDWVDQEWVNAGLWINGAYKAINLKTDSMTKSIYDTSVSNGTATQYSEMNRLFNIAIVGHGKDCIEYFFKSKSLKFHYCFTINLIAGTDNSSKNTYHVIDPKARTAENDGAQFAVNTTFSAWFLENYGYEFDYTEIYQVEEHGDDMDSILPFNNNANLTKPYYIDRMHPYKDDNEANGSLYEGLGNALFNFVEVAYEDSKELQSMMHSIMVAMCNLVGEDDNLINYSGNKKSLMGFFHKYFFNIQNYFPKIAYLEQNRIRYEFPEMIGFVSSGAGARGVRPITQALGSQLENEKQFVTRRLIYFASYAAFGALGRDGDIGIPDATASQNWIPANLPDGSPADYVLTLTPHQYIYPTGVIGQTVVDPHVRVGAGKSYAFTVATGVSGSDTGMGILGANYYSDYGNLGTLSTTSTFTVNGKRLVKIIMEGTYSYASNMRCSSLDISAAKNVRHIRAAAFMRGLSCELDMSKNTRCTNIEVISTKFSNVIFPETHTLTSIVWRYAYDIPSLVLNNMPNLQSFNYLGTGFVYAAKKVEIGENVAIETGLSFQSLIESLANYSVLTTLKVLNNFSWTDLDANVMEWLSEIPTCELKGTISIKEDDPYGNPRITWDLKNKINAKFGCVDSTNVEYGYKGLTLDYQKREFNPNSAYIKGNFYVEAGNTFKFEVRPSSIYENSHIDIQYNGVKIPGTISKDGVLTIFELANTKSFGDVRGFVYYISPVNGVKYYYDIQKTIEIWNRPAQIGDLVYADGTFSSAETWEGEKTPIGICFYVPPRDENGNVLPKYANADDKQLRLMVALEETVVPINGENTSSLQWGAQLQSSEQTEEWIQQNALYHLDAEGNRVNLTSSKAPNVYDVRAVRNLTSRGLDNPYIDPERVPLEGEAPFDYLDESDEASFNYGFKCITPDMAMGDGFAYNESQVSFNSVGERTLTSELARLAGVGYSEGDIVNSGYAKTLKIIAHRNDLLNNNILGADGEVVYQGGTLPLPTASGTTTEMKALGTLIDQLRTWASQENGLNDPYPKKWQQLAYPFVSACYAYQPTQELKDGEALADKFKVHNWFAPTEGQLARICWYAKYGDKAGLDAFKVAREKSLLGKLTTTSSYHWSVTETNSHNTCHVYFGSGMTSNYSKYNSFVGRAVSAF